MRYVGDFSSKRKKSMDFENILGIVSPNEIYSGFWLKIKNTTDFKNLLGIVSQNEIYYGF